MYKVAFATGSRADYGIVRNYISRLNADPEVDFSVLVTGALLDEAYGSAVSIIEADGFRIGHRCKLSLKVGSTADTVHIMSEVLDDFGKYFEEQKPDLLIILGDRYEIYAVSIAAAMQRVPILHLHGGEITLANYDEFIRHSITKMSRWHFTSTEEYRRRVIQLGENPADVYWLGALGAENCLEIDKANVPAELLDIDNCFTVLFHPETLNPMSPGEQMKVVLEAVSGFAGKYKLVFIGSNADTRSDQIGRLVEEFCKNHPGAVLYKNLHPDAYHWLVSRSYALVGNSSSGIIEVPSLGAFTVNIGDRQTGRVKGESVLDVPCNATAIAEAMQYSIFHKGEAAGKNPYYKPDAARLYYETTKKILRSGEGKGFKEFYDL